MSELPLKFSGRSRTHFKFRSVNTLCQAQKALYDLDSQNDITQPDNPLYWPKGAVKDLSQDEPKEKDDLDELELLQKNPLISNQIIHKRVPGKNFSRPNLTTI